MTIIRFLWLDIIQKLFVFLFLLGFMFHSMLRMMRASLSSNLTIGVSDAFSI